jgi:hypothetical protein
MQNRRIAAAVAFVLVAGPGNTARAGLVQYDFHQTQTNADLAQLFLPDTVASPTLGWTASGFVPPGGTPVPYTVTFEPGFASANGLPRRVDATLGPEDSIISDSGPALDHGLVLFLQNNNFVFQLTFGPAAGEDEIFTPPTGTNTIFFGDWTFTREVSTVPEPATGVSLAVGGIFWLGGRTFRRRPPR